MLLSVAAACEPKLVVGELACGSGEAGGPAVEPNVGEAIDLPWQTSFERGFCEYRVLKGFCYPAGHYEISSLHVHSGKQAAAFTVSGMAGAEQQARCVRQGTLPKQAYYSAYYFVPEAAVNTGNWNLFHFQGGNDADSLHSLWDVSLHSADNGDLSLYVFDFLGTGIRGRGETPRIPIGEWFEIGFYLRRAADETGEVALYQNGQRIFELTNIRTDDSSWGQWYVGNLASELDPPVSTLYVDDVAIRESP